MNYFCTDVNFQMVLLISGLAILLVLLYMTKQLLFSTQETAVFQQLVK